MDSFDASEGTIELQNMSLQTGSIGELLQVTIDRLEILWQEIGLSTIEKKEKEQHEWPPKPLNVKQRNC